MATSALERLRRIGTCCLCQKKKRIFPKIRQGRTPYVHPPPPARRPLRLRARTRPRKNVRRRCRRRRHGRPSGRRAQVAGRTGAQAQRRADDRPLRRPLRRQHALRAQGQALPLRQVRPRLRLLLRRGGRDGDLPHALRPDDPRRHPRDAAHREGAQDQPILRPRGRRLHLRHVRPGRPRPHPAHVPER